MKEGTILDRTVVVPVDGGPADVPSIDLASALAGRTGRIHLILVYVVEVPQQFPLDADLPEQIAVGEEVLQRAEDYARERGEHPWASVSTTLLQARLAAAAVVDEAIERGADVIIIGTSNQRQYGELTQGAVAPYVLDNAPCDVIVLRVAGEIEETR